MIQTHCKEGFPGTDTDWYIRKLPRSPNHAVFGQLKTNNFLKNDVITGEKKNEDLLIYIYSSVKRTRYTGVHFNDIDLKLSYFNLFSFRSIRALESSRALEFDPAIKFIRLLIFN